MMEIARLEVGQLATNCYIVHSNGVAFVVDPGAEAERIKAFCDEQNLTVEGILLTHGHYDHTGAVKELKQLTNAKIHCTEDCNKIANSVKSMAFGFGATIQKFDADVLVKDDDHIAIGNMNINVMATPGHTKGGACFIVEHNIFSGDTLFQTSYGRTDFPTGDMKSLENSLRRLFALEGDYNVYPGHGACTTLDIERKHNLIHFND
jgi:glyoxylase-like metal-dependent hydrolase (beta-lactamase superfamily II)